MIKKILITGANGFLGASITRLALKKKYKVSVLVRKTSNMDNLEDIKSRIEVFYGDLRHRDDVSEPVKHADIIFHVAADYRLWSIKPGELYDTNVHGTENIALAALEYKKKMIYTSSVATLGNSESENDEETNVKFDDMIGDYKKSKYLAEKIVERLIKKNLNAIIVNPSTPIGPGDTRPTPTGKIILDLLQNKMPAYVDTGLNFVHVDDVAEGHFLALKKGKIGEKYILGGENLSFKDFLDAVSNEGGVKKANIKLKTSLLYPLAYLNELFCNMLLNNNPRLTVDSLRMSEKKMFFSSQKAKNKLGYRPRPVKSAIKDAVNWMKIYFKLCESND